MENQEPLLIPEESKTSKSKKDWRVELMLFLVLGVLLGIVIKTEAAKRITMGYEDHKVSLGEQVYSVNDIQKELAEKAKEEPVGTDSVPSVADPLGGTCGN